MNRLAVINVVGLTESLIGEHTPRIAEFRQRGALAHIAPAFPAVTCTAQSNYLTGTNAVAARHRRQRLVQPRTGRSPVLETIQPPGAGPKIWDELRARSDDSPIHQSTIANCFWWFNMYSSVDYSITPRPIYPRRRPERFSTFIPGRIPSATEIKKDLGEFPFFGFWGPAAGIDTPQGQADCASRWIAESAKWIENKYSPDAEPDLSAASGLQFATAWAVRIVESFHGCIGQRFDDSTIDDSTNPAIHRDLREIDAIVGDLIDFFGKRGVQVVLLSEYGITNVDTPVHLNRIFREHGWLAVKEELGLEILDAGASKVFAVADHQVAHIYLNDPSLEKSVRELLEKTPRRGKSSGRSGENRRRH